MTKTTTTTTKTTDNTQVSIRRAELSFQLRGAKNSRETNKPLFVLCCLPCCFQCFTNLNLLISMQVLISMCFQSSPLSMSFWVPIFLTCVLSISLPLSDQQYCGFLIGQIPKILLDVFSQGSQFSPYQQVFSLILLQHITAAERTSWARAAVAVAQSVRAFVLQAEGWALESLPQQTVKRRSYISTAKRSATGVSVTGPR